MILVDTSVWIDHLNAPVPELLSRLNAGEVLIHHLVIGEIACGTMRNRGEVLSNLQSLPRIREVDHERVFREIETNRLMGRGIGFIDAHLLTSVLAHGDATLWTRDLRLQRIAEEMGVATPEHPL